jgi:uncharacterized tellurite resistance protein B-like protein
MLDLEGDIRSESAAAWIRLAQGISMADREVAPSECETTVQFSLTLLKISPEELPAAKKRCSDVSIEWAADVIQRLNDHFKRLILLGLVNVAFSDHKFKVPENNFLASITKQIGLKPKDLVDAFIAARLMDATGTPPEIDENLTNGTFE